MRQRMAFLVSGTIGFFFFIIFSYIVDRNVFKQFDFDTTVRLQDDIPRRLDDVFSWFSFYGSFEVTLVFLLFLLAFLFFKRKFLGCIVAFFLFGMFHILEIFGKGIVENTPPPEFLLRTKRMVEFDQFHVRTEFSYPSGHSGRTIFLSVLLIGLIISRKQWPVWLRLCLLGGIVLFDFLMLLSRVYLGEHWSTDVVGGAILGASFALLSLFFFFKTKPQQ